ncbi:MAG: steroid-24-oyl-CoA synthetase [Ilumatobacteraceae bacterium]
MMTIVWGTNICRGSGAIPFQGYEPRRHQTKHLLLDAQRWSQRTHLIQGARRLTYESMFESIERVAADLHRAGLRPGDRLMILAANSPEWVITMWASVRLGAVTALGNGWWSPAEVAHAVSLIEPRLIVTDTHRGALLPDTFPPQHVVDVSTVREWVDDVDRASERRVPEMDVSEDEPAFIIFTAGTTGFSKAVVLAHRSVISNLHGLLAVSGRLPHLIDPDRPGAVVLQSGPLFHIGGLQSLLLALVAGNTMVFLEGRFDAGEVIRLIDEESVTVWGAIPTMASRVLEHPSLGERDLSRVRSISMGGAPVLPELAARLRVAFPGAERGMSTIYGMTETGGTVASASGKLMAEHPLTSGRPMPVVDLRIDAPDADGIGEIVVRTPGQMIGYWGIKAADIVEPDGWLHTGDLGRFTDGLLWVTGRSKDIIIRGGENIAAAHVEQALMTHPDVAAVAVVGLPDADLGERVGAVVQLREGAVATPSGLAEYASQCLARFEVPASWWLRYDEIPMSDAGKVEKHKLREKWPEAEVIAR